MSEVVNIKTAERPSNIAGSLATESTNPYAYEDLTVRDKFLLLSGIWRFERPNMSSLVKDRINHPAYREIVKMGMVVVPFILKDLDDRLDDWFDALERITSENPVPKESYGKLSEMRTIWQLWGQERGLF